MLVFFKHDLKQLHEKQRQEQERKAEISELQDAVCELAEIVSGAADTNADGKDGAENG